MCAAKNRVYAQFFHRIGWTVNFLQEKLDRSPPSEPCSRDELSPACWRLSKHWTGQSAPDAVASGFYSAMKNEATEARITALPRHVSGVAHTSRTWKRMLTT